MRPETRTFSRTIPSVVVLATAVALVACSATPTPRGEVKGSDATVSEWLQSDMNRVANVSMRENLNALYRLADKLYRRNPAEWKKGGYASRDDALKGLKAAIESLTEPVESGNSNAENSPEAKAVEKDARQKAVERAWPALKGKRDIDAMDLALSPGFTGDRVGAFIFSTVDMLITAHGGKTEFYLIDGQDAQNLYNAARNLEIAVWMLGHRKGDNGKPLLLADEINASERNLSFEREFGKIIARTDLLAAVTTEKYRRAVIGYAQNFVGGTFLQFLPVR